MRSEHQRFNYALSQSRIKVEHCLGMMKLRCMSLKGLRLAVTSKRELARAHLSILVAALLHNFLSQQTTSTSTTGSCRSVNRSLFNWSNNKPWRGASKEIIATIATMRVKVRMQNDGRPFFVVSNSGRGSSGWHSDLAFVQLFRMNQKMGIRYIYHLLGTNEVV